MQPQLVALNALGYSTDKDALNAIHRFLHFQIDEHKTGGPVDVH
jgi:hypothetical protein